MAARRPPGSLQSRQRWKALASGASAVHTLALAHLQQCLVQHVSEKTVLVRAYDLAQFAQWCQERDIVGPSEITKPMLERYQRHLFYYRKADGAPLAIGRQLHMLHSLQAWFRWLTRNNHIAANPAADLELPRPPRRQLRQPLSVQEMEQALSSLDADDPVKLRDRAMFEVLYSTGLRRAELVKLTVFDIDTRNGTVFVRQGKGRKDRFVPIGERALLWLKRYCEEVRVGWYLNPKQSALFLNPDGSVPTVDALTWRARRLLKRAGVQKPGACHLFRHTMATEMLDRGADLRYVQEMLGHASIGTTQIYTHVSIAKLKAVHAATHPGARLRAADADGDEPGAA